MSRIRRRFCFARDERACQTVVAEWTWRLSYEHGRPVGCDESARHDGGQMTERYEYDRNGRLTSVTGNRQTPGLTDHWSLAVHTAPDGQILEPVDAEGTRIYPAPEPFGTYANRRAA